MLLPKEERPSLPAGRQVPAGRERSPIRCTTSILFKVIKMVATTQDLLAIWIGGFGNITKATPKALGPENLGELSILKPMLP